MMLFTWNLNPVVKRCSKVHTVIQAVERHKFVKIELGQENALRLYLIKRYSLNVPLSGGVKKEWNSYNHGAGCGIFEDQNDVH